MPLHRVDKLQSKLHFVKPSGFADQQWQERKDLQPLLRDNPESIDPEVLVISEEFTNWESSSRRIDLLGLDKEANLVVTELKQVENGGHMELQALRYAAMVSAMDFEAVVSTHEQFLSKLGKDPTIARRAVRDFLELEDVEEGVISNTPRIILISPSFSHEITTTVLWLSNQGLDIRCIEANLYNLDNAYYLDIEQVIPLPSAADYQIKIREKDNQAVKVVSAKRRGKSLDILVENGVLIEGTRIHLIRSPKLGLDIHVVDEAAKYATFDQDRRDFKWDMDRENYSLSALCKVVCEKYGVAVGSGAFPGPDYWAIDGESEPLYTRAKKLSAISSE